MVARLHHNAVEAHKEVNMQAPEKIDPGSLADYLDVMSKSVFQAGISWLEVEAKWPEIRQAVRGFEPAVVADLTEKDLDDLTNDRRVIRNRRKLDAIVENARRMVDLAEHHGSFHIYLRSHGGFENMVKDLRKQFRFLGNTGAHHFLWVVNEEVPFYEEWCASRGRTPQTAVPK